jgi:hypothetical protein
MDKKIPQTKRPNFIAIVCIVGAIALVLATIFTILTPQKEKIIANDFTVNNYDNTQSTFKKISYSGSDFSLPERFNIYQAQNSSGIAEELANKLIIDLQLTADSNIENYWLSPTSALAKNSHEHYYVLNNASTAKGDREATIITDEAIKNCLNFYSKYNLLLPLVAQKDDVLYLNSGFEQSIVEARDASAVQIPLTYELDGYKVFYENQNDYPFFCRVNNLYELERVVFRDFFQEFQIVKQVPPISVDQAVSNIKKGSVSIIQAKSEITSVVDLNWINTADLYSVALEYRYDEQLKIAYPFYKFQAKLTNSAGINIQAELITPAVASAVAK